MKQKFVKEWEFSGGCLMVKCSVENWLNEMIESEAYAFLEFGFYSVCFEFDYSDYYITEYFKNKFKSILETDVDRFDGEFFAKLEYNSKSFEDYKRLNNSLRTEFDKLFRHKDENNSSCV